MGDIKGKLGNWGLACIAGCLLDVTPIILKNIKSPLNYPWLLGLTLLL